MQFLYNISIRFYILAIRIASLFRPKAKLWIKGRKNIFQKLKAATENENNIVLFHCASLGEFEQGRPIMEGYKHKYPTHKILLTFFSPSGFENQKNYNEADWVFYLPAVRAASFALRIRRGNRRIAHPVVASACEHLYNENYSHLRQRD